MARGNIPSFGSEDDDVEELYVAGTTALESGDYTLAHEKLRQAAVGGFVWAFYELAILNGPGLISPYSPDIAIDYFYKAAAAGRPEAQAKRRLLEAADWGTFEARELAELASERNPAEGGLNPLAMMCACRHFDVICKTEDATNEVIASELDDLSSHENPAVRGFIERAGIKHSFYERGKHRIVPGSSADQITDALNEFFIGMWLPGEEPDASLMARCTIVGHIILKSPLGSHSKPLLGLHQFFTTTTPKGRGRTGVSKLPTSPLKPFILDDRRPPILSFDEAMGLQPPERDEVSDIQAAPSSAGSEATWPALQPLSIPYAASPLRDSIRHHAMAIRIPHLVHFTRATNLPSIMKHGLYSRERALESGVTPEVNDILRLDGRRDGTSLSIGFPNHRMFYKYRKECVAVDWAVLILDPSILWEKDCAFCCRNAAHASMRSLPLSVLGTALAFRWMFAEIEGCPSRTDQGLHPYDPTDEQAEVLVFDVIEPRYVTEVHFERRVVLTEYAPYLTGKKGHVAGSSGVFSSRNYARNFA